MNETLDNLFAKCQQLPDEDFEVLMSAMIKEHKAREDKVAQAAWDRVLKALHHFTEHYGEIVIQDDRYGFRQLSLSDEPSFSSSRFGIIEIT